MSVIVKIFKHYSYERYMYRLKTRKTISDNKQINKIVSEIEDKGICVLNNYIEKKLINKIKLEISESLKNKNIIKKLQIYDFNDQGIKRYLSADKLSKTANKLFYNSFFDEIAKHYVSKNVVAYQKMYEIKGSEGKFATTDIFHFDDWRKRFKVFLYLNDVGINNCPFCYIPKSIKSDKKRILKEFEYVALGKSGSYGYYLNHEMENLKKRKNYSEITVTGEAGTVILVDTRGLHKGNPSIFGNKRELLASYYDLR